MIDDQCSIALFQALYTLICLCLYFIEDNIILSSASFNQRSTRWDSNSLCELGVRVSIQQDPLHLDRVSTLLSHGINKNCEGHPTHALLTGQKRMPQRYLEVKLCITSSKPLLLFPLCCSYCFYYEIHWILHFALLYANTFSILLVFLHRTSMFGDLKSLMQAPDSAHEEPSSREHGEDVPV
ncbi:hypothetical protein EV424DRAFT_1388829, partial [Suillus variegatus]